MVIDNSKIRRCAFCKKVLDNDNPNKYCNDEHKQMRQEKNREYYLKHKEECNERSNTWKKDHPEERNAYAREYYQKNIEKMQEKERARAEYKKQWRSNKIAKQVDEAYRNLIDEKHNTSD